MYTLLANKGHATLFKNKRGKFTLNRKFENESLTRKESSIFSDRAGNGETSFTSNKASFSESHYKDEEISKFCNEIIDYLTFLDNQGKLDSLTLICEPSFLGEFRKKITPNLKSLINEEISKNFHTEEPQKLKLFLENHEVSFYQ